MIIRTAAIADAPEIARLTLQLGYEIEEEEARHRLDRLMINPDNALFVAQVDRGQLAGWVHIHGRHLIESASFGEIGGLVVDRLHRRKGIGEQLMRKCEEWAMDKGYKEVRLRSGGPRKEAHEFYNNIGYKNVKWQQVFSLILTSEHYSRK